MRKRSAGILMYRINYKILEVLLAHPGGPFYKNKDLGAWSIPKGEFADDELPKAAAIREFREELGVDVQGEMLQLTPVIQKSGKEVLVWALEGDLNPDEITSNTFPLEWPPRSGQIREFAEVDRVEWFQAEEAKTKIIPGQIPIIQELELILNQPD